MSPSDIIRAAGERGDLLASTVDNLEVWITSEFLPDWVADSIGELVEDEAWTELNDRFYQQLKFGTGGMRGRTIGAVVSPAERGNSQSGNAPDHAAVGTNVLNDFNVLRATLGLFHYTRSYLRETLGNLEIPKLVIAHDVRHFSRHFCELAASAWGGLGGQAFIFDGPRSTPQLSFTLRHLRAHAGVVITASHNPPHDNGFKAYFIDGGQVVTPHAEGIVEAVEKVRLEELAPFLEADLSRVTVLPAALDVAYSDALRENVIDDEVLARQSPKVVFTPIHGTGSIIAGPLLREYGVEVIEVEAQQNPDPGFSTVQSPNPENAEALEMAIQRAEETGADAVIGTDPDADRMGVAVRNGEGKLVLLTGNQIGACLAAYRIETLKESGVLPPEGTDRAALIKTFVTSGLQETIARAHGLKVIDTLTGFKFIGEKLKDYQEEMEAALFEEEGVALDYDRTDQWTRAELLLEYSTYMVFGGEESYGYLASDRVRDKDANAAALLFCELLAYLKSNQLTIPDYLDALFLEHGYFTESLVNLYYEGAAGSQKISRILESYRNHPPDLIGGVSVTSRTDFAKDTIRDADNKRIPAQDFFLLELEDGYRFAVRGSGTEPKIKFYLFGREEVKGPDGLQTARKRAADKMSALAKSIETDARSRAEEETD